MVKSLSDFLQTMPNIAPATVAATGAEAIEVCSRFQPHLILLDFAQPSIDGLDAAEALRRLSPGTRIVVISHYAPFLAEAGPWPGVDAIVDILDLGRKLPGLIDRLFPAQQQEGTS
jgi:chemotaxis response regulator CheB